MIGNCDHHGFHSGMAKMSGDFRSIRFIVICDGCGEEMQEVHVEEYAPGYDPAGSHARRGSQAA